jgi:DNA-binding transcriptional LysR family regulator
MNFQHVRAFCMIVSEGSFSRAAERLHLTQPTISAQIQALEKNLRSRLFERSAQGISLTQAGKLFHPYALQMIELSERAGEAISEMRGLERGTLQVGASTVPGHYLLPRLLARFKADYPGLDVSLTVGNSQEVRNGVRDGLYEIGFVGEMVRDERVTYEPIYHDHLVAAMRPEHPLSGRKSLHPQDLLGQPLVAREYGSGTRSTVEKALASRGVRAEELTVFLELSSTEAIKRAIREVDALAVVSALAVRDEQSMGLIHVAALEGVNIDRDLHFIRRTHGYLSQAAEAFLKLLRAALK